jgi:hypothetical protein
MARITVRTMATLKSSPSATVTSASRAGPMRLKRTAFSARVMPSGGSAFGPITISVKMPSG